MSLPPYLTTQFGSQLERLDRYSRLILIGSIAITAAIDDEGLPLEDTYEQIENLFLDEMIATNLIEMLPQLGQLSRDELFRLTQALINQISLKEAK